MSVTSRRNDPFRPQRPRHAFEFRTTALFGDKWTGDSALLSRNHLRTRLRYRLCPRGNFGALAKNFAGGIDRSTLTALKRFRLGQCQGFARKGSREIRVRVQTSWDNRDMTCGGQKKREAWISPRDHCDNDRCSRS
jgi:hypothetical protein